MEEYFTPIYLSIPFAVMTALVYDMPRGGENIC